MGPFLFFINFASAIAIVAQLVERWLPKPKVAKILTSPKASDYNTFENPDKIKLADFSGARIDKKTGDLVLEIPAASIVTLEVE